MINAVHSEPCPSPCVSVCRMDAANHWCLGNLCITPRDARSSPKPDDLCAHMARRVPGGTRKPLGAQRAGFGPNPNGGEALRAGGVVAKPRHGSGHVCVLRLAAHHRKDLAAHGAAVCRGSLDCWRSLDEIATWSQMSPQAQRAVCSELGERATRYAQQAAVAATDSVAAHTAGPRAV